MQQAFVNSPATPLLDTDGAEDLYSQRAGHDHLHQQAAMLSSQPVMHQLLSSQDAMTRLASQSPIMQRMLDLNPFMRDMLRPETATQLLQAAQNPQALQSLLGMP